jgi:acetate kinase
MVLVVNCGSSSLKYQLFTMVDERQLASGVADRVGANNGQGGILKHRTDQGSVELNLDLPDHEVALGHVLAALVNREYGVMQNLEQIHAVGHRVVHGGEKFSGSELVTEEVIKGIEQVSQLAPLHNPANLLGIRACQQKLPHAPQVAVFDTAFHQTMPREAFLYGLPYELYEKQGIRRYGFHGTSHRYVSQVATQMLHDRGLPGTDHRVITCHLGNGCSMAAIKGGHCIDTTMGLTPLEGLLMGTRCGDLDPAIALYLQDQLKMTSHEIDTMLNKESGLLGVSGLSNDMRDIRAAKDTNERAQAAFDIFCYRVRKYIGAYAAALGGVDAVVFTAGIGENEKLMVEQVTEGLECLGLCLDHEKNKQPRPDSRGWDLATDDSPGRIFVIPTDEELMIVRDTVALVNGL